MHIMYDEEKVSNAKCMCVVEGEASLSQPEIAIVPPEEEVVLVLQGQAVIVLLEEEIPPEEEEVPIPAFVVPQGPLSRSHRRKRRC
jgi:hypothetical protein